MNRLVIAQLVQRRLRVGLFVAGFLLAIVAVACTGGGGDSETASTQISVTTQQPTTTEAPTTTTTTTTLPPTLDELLRGHLAAESFSATVTAEIVTSQPGGTIVGSGTGSISGADSELRLTSDLTGLRGTFVDPTGRVIGQDGLKEISQATVVAEGSMYRQDDDGRWRVTDPAQPETTLSHVIDVLQGVAAFEEAGTEIVDGAELTVMRPSEPAAYDPRYYDLDLGIVGAFDADTAVLVDDEGLPVQIRLSIGVDIESGTTTFETDIEATYSLSRVGATGAIQKPAEAWVNLTSFGFTPGPGVPPLVDIEVPAGSIMTDLLDGWINLDLPTGVFFTAFSNILSDQGRGPIEEIWPQLLAEVGIEPDAVLEPDFSVYPSRLAILEDAEQDTFMMFYTEAELGTHYFSVAWVGPRDSQDAQQADFEDLLTTITWLNPSELIVPGETAASTLLQQDVLNLLQPTVADGTGCDSPMVLWTDLVSGGFDDWTEDWYLNPCGEIVVYTGTFTKHDDETTFTFEGGGN